MMSLALDMQGFLLHVISALYIYQSKERKLIFCKTILKMTIFFGKEIYSQTTQNSLTLKLDH